MLKPVVLSCLTLVIMLGLFVSVFVPILVAGGDSSPASLLVLDPTPSHVSAAAGDAFFFDPTAATPIPVLFFVGWLLFRRRSRVFGSVTTTEASIAMAVLLGAVVAYGWAVFVGARSFASVAAMLWLAGASMLLGGRRGLGSVSPAIAMLWFVSGPSPVLVSELMFAAQVKTAAWAGFLLELIGETVMVRGERIYLSTRTFMVIESCAGLRTVLSILMMSILAAEVLELRRGRALILILSAPLIAFAANSVRVAVVALTVESYRNQDHTGQGIAVFVGALSFVFALGILLDRLPHSSGPDAAVGESSGRVAPAGRSAIAEKASWLRDLAEKQKSFGVANAALVLMLVASAWLEPWREARVFFESPSQLIERAAEEMEPVMGPVDRLFAGSTRALEEALGRVRIDGREVEIYLGVGDDTARGSTIFTPRLAWPQSGLEVLSDGKFPIMAHGVVGRRTVLDGGASSFVSYSWYQNASSSSAVEWARHSLGIDRSPFRRDALVVAIRLSSEVEGRGEAAIAEAERRLHVVYEMLVPELEGYARRPG